MKRIIASAALACALYIPTLGTAAELKVTAREAGIVAADAGDVKPGANTGIVPPNFKPAAVEAPAPAVEPSKYVIVATITIADQPVYQMKYRHEPFDDEASCKAFIESDDGLKASNARLGEIAKAKINPDAKVGVSCEEDSE